MGAARGRDDPAALSGIRKYSLSIRGHRTSVSLEAPFFDELDAIARRRGLARAGLIAEIDAARPASTNLSSALRLYVLDWLKNANGEAGRR